VPANNYPVKLRRYLRSQGSPLAPYAPLIARMEAKYKLPQGIIAGIAGAETSLGKAGRGPSMKNAWGWMTGAGPPNQRSFPTWQSAIRQYARFLSANYPTNRGLSAIGGKYVYGDPSRPGPSTWVANASAVMRAVGGDPGGGAPPARVPGNLRLARKPQAAKTAAQTDDRTNKLMMLMALMAIRSNNPDTTMAAISVISALRTRTGPPKKPVIKDRPPARSSAAPMYNGKGLALPTTINSTHSTSGLAGFPAFDFMAPAGTPVYAPADGLIDPQRPYGWLERQDPTAGFGGSRLYLKGANGRVYYIAHMARNLVAKPGDRVRKGQLIGYVWDWEGTGNTHVHMGVRG